MILIELKYNPYKVETNVLIDNKKLKPGSLLDKIKIRRLQEWIEQFPEDIASEIGSDDFRVIFHGTSLDFDDVLYAFNHSVAYNKIDLAYVKSKINEEDKITQITELFEKINNGPFEELKTPELINAFKEASSDKFETSVVATMSSGKSTLINALMRQDLMPSKQEACTAIVTKIIDDNRDGTRFDAKQFDKDKKLLKGIQNVSLSELEEWNNDVNTNEVELIGNIPFVSSENTKLILVDTPGPNNSRNEEHSRTTFSNLGKSAKTLIIYVLNATQLSTNDDSQLLRRIADSMKSGGKKSRDRFLFVVNKLDNFKPGKDDIEGSLNRVRDYLEDMGIKDPNIYGASAQNALDIRTILQDKTYEELDEDEDEEYELRGKIRRVNKMSDYHFEKYSPLVPSHQRIIQERLEKAIELDDKKEQALIHSGIPSVEEAINLYVNKYAIPQKIKNLVDTFYGTIAQLKIQEELVESIRDNQEAKKNLEKQIKIINKKIATEDDKKNFEEALQKDELKGKIQERTRKLINKANTELNKITKFEKDKEYSVEEARERYYIVTKEVDQYTEQLEIESSELLTDIANEKVDQLMSKYEQITRELFEKQEESEKLLISPFELLGFHSNNISIEDLEGLVYTEPVKIGEIKNDNRKWYKPWTWKEAKNEDVYEDQSYVKSDDLMLMFSSVTANLFKFENTIISIAESNQVKINEYLQKEFNKFDEAILELLEEIQEKSVVMKHTEDQLKEIKERKTWLDNVGIDLDSILTV